MRVCACVLSRLLLMLVSSEAVQAQKSFVSESMDDILGGHQFSDPESKESLHKLLNTTLQRLVKVCTRLSV